MPSRWASVRDPLHDRVVAGIGVPMISSIMECARAAASRNVPGHRRRRHPLFGGCRHGRRRNCAMIGNLFAGTDESPAN